MSDTPEFLQNALKFGINLGLTRMNALCEILNHPEKDLKVIHVAGTNGKGSTVTYISSILARAGLKVGIYTSPFLERFGERIRILDGYESLLRYVNEDDSEGEIPEDALKEISAEVEKATEVMLNNGMEHPTEFELVTAVAFLWFKEQNCDIVVLETGLGGRYDSTNVIDKPLCTAICAIGLDHTDRLGDTVTKITGEKTGIFKPGVPAVVTEPSDMILTESQQEEVRAVFEKTAKDVGCELIISKIGSASFRYSDEGTMVFKSDVTNGRIYETTLLGEHQISNCSLAVNVIRTLNRDGEIYVTEDQISDGVKLASWKGRVERVCGEPIVILDGGHNPQGATSLVSVLENISGICDAPSMRLVFGGMADKDLRSVIGIFKSSKLNIDEVYCTRVNNSRSMSGSDLCNEFKLVYNNGVNITSFEDAADAVETSLKASFEDKKPLLITGSLYLLGQIRGTVLKIIKEKGNADV